MSSDNLDSFSAYARHRGVSQPYVSKLVKMGKIPTVDGKIDRVAADKALAETIDPRRDNVRKFHAEQRSGRAPEDEDEPMSPAAFEAMTQTEAQTAKLQVQAKREELAYRLAVHEVVEITALRKGLADLIAIAANQLRTIPDRIAERAAATSDIRAVHAMIDAEILSVQQQIADSGATLIERLTATSQ